jgi:hypothetical protein
MIVDIASMATEKLSYNCKMEIIIVAPNMDLNSYRNILIPYTNHLMTFHYYSSASKAIEYILCVDEAK